MDITTKTPESMDVKEYRAGVKFAYEVKVADTLAKIKAWKELGITKKPLGYIIKGPNRTNLSGKTVKG